jgi:hypothetical protein
MWSTVPVPLTGSVLSPRYADTDDMNGAEVGFVSAFVEPETREVEGRPVSPFETQNPLVEAAGFFQMGGTYRIVG